MNYEARKFSKASYNKYNDSTINKVVKHLELSGYTVLNKEETYSHDLLIEKDGKQMYVEVEASVAWDFTNRESFKYPRVNFLGRKEKMHHETPYLYVIVCLKTNWAVACESNIIYEQGIRKQIHINSEFKKGADEVFQVPKEQCGFFKLKS